MNPSASPSTLLPPAPSATRRDDGRAAAPAPPPPRRVSMEDNVEDNDEGEDLALDPTNDPDATVHRRRGSRRFQRRNSIARRRGSVASEAARATAASSSLASSSSSGGTLSAASSLASSWKFASDCWDFDSFDSASRRRDSTGEESHFGESQSSLYYTLDELEELDELYEEETTGGGGGDENEGRGVASTAGEVGDGARPNAEDVDLDEFPSLNLATRPKRGGWDHRHGKQPSARGFRLSLQERLERDESVTCFRRSTLD